ncbi:MAG: DinB family protein [Bacteroidota bacterium]
MNKWINAIDQNSHEFQDAFGGLSAKQLNWKPNSKTWSIGQNLDHLIVINSTYFPILKALKDGTYKVPFHGRIGFIVDFFGKMIHKSVEPEKDRKITTFPIWEPSSSTIPPNILDQFLEHQEELKQQVKGSEALIRNEVVISSPANGTIVYKLEKAFDIIITHEKRHLLQAKRVLHSM